MKNNDISNKQAPFVGFDIDSLLFMEEKDKGIFKTFADLFKSEKTLYMNRAYNKRFIAGLRSVWNNHEVSIVLLTGQLLELDELHELENKLDQDQIPFTNLYSFVEWDEIRLMLGSNQLLYFFSENDDLLSYMSSKHALRFSELRSVFG